MTVPHYHLAVMATHSLILGEAMKLKIEYKNIDKLIAYINNARTHSDDQVNQIAGHSDLNRDHWTSKSQWNMPTREVYESFQKWGIDNGVDVFQKEYDELKKRILFNASLF